MNDQRETCPACGCERLTPRASYASFDNHARFKGRGTGVFNSDFTVGPSQARICLECGHVLLFVAGDKLSQLRQIFDKPVTKDPNE